MEMNRDHSVVFRDECKEIEENNRIGKTSDLFKKIRDTNRIFHAKMGTIKDRNGMDLREVENIKKRWQEYTEELYRKDLHDLDNHDGVITHIESDILKCTGWDQDHPFTYWVKAPPKIFTTQIITMV